MPDLPKEQLVASCYAATLPSEATWSKYVAEAEKLRAQGSVEEEDYAVLLHSLEARQKLMELTLDDSEILHGTVENILNAAKSKYTKNITEELETIRRRGKSQADRLEAIVQNVERFAYILIAWGLVTMWAVILVVGLSKKAPSSWNQEVVFSTDSAIFLAFAAVTLLNLLFGFKHSICAKQSH